ncbi:CoA pyrophosphatase [Celeribacter halophilus]|uniref:CoA pyrophosphatase n=1 Tax=Celeribacter halophilus TaxID=576117 RepID=UPI001C08141A|nr:CoA pyrophosphatase [Celeribacter halophilus]MBU2889788.1 CoA pyrophosphatase [Celeribacter halophilus]MDO6512106.1 CoA pyrophosphatase [Celeribacter halophilus]
MVTATDRARISALLQYRGEPSSDFDLNKDLEPAIKQPLRPAGVLVPIRETADGLRLILTKRSSALKHHPGQIAFPGGRVEPTDVSPVEAALREAHEEIGLPPSVVEVLGQLPTHQTVTQFEMYPVLGWIRGDCELTPEAGEVSEIFEVPLSHVLNSANFTIQSRRWRGHMRSFYTVPYGPYYIWGATARILRVLADRVAQ